MKVAVFGGGSSYTPELVKGFLDRRESFPMTELWLADISQERLDVVGGFAQRMARAAGSPFEVRLTTDQREAIEGASYVTTQLRVGGMAARREDEYLGKRHGLIGQETTGVGGMAKALRTIPVILEHRRATCRSLRPGRCWSTSRILPAWSPKRWPATRPRSRRSASATCPSPPRCGCSSSTSAAPGASWTRRAPNSTRSGLNHLSWHRA